MHVERVDSGPARRAGGIRRQREALRGRGARVGDVRDGGVHGEGDRVVDEVEDRGRVGLVGGHGGVWE